ncbi:MAG: hypothetical protein LUG18_05250 [Candidatus Azobacteroides sp.]|nr:hypothetical protein [Candidatus Azobacteroides sp.]
MKRYSAQYIYDGKQLYYHQIIEITDEGSFRLFPLEEEIHSVEFYNGLILMVENQQKSEQIEKSILSFFKTNKHVLEVFHAVSERRINPDSGNIHVFLLENIDLQKFLWLTESNVRILN